MLFSQSLLSAVLDAMQADKGVLGCIAIPSDIGKCCIVGPQCVKCSVLWQHT